MGRVPRRASLTALRPAMISDITAPFLGNKGAEIIVIMVSAPSYFLQTERITCWTQQSFQQIHSQTFQQP